MVHNVFSLLSMNTGVGWLVSLSIINSISRSMRAVCIIMRKIREIYGCVDIYAHEN